MAQSINNLDLGGKSIFIVEDDFPSIRYYETILKSSGATITVFRNGKEFIDCIEEGLPEIDMVFMDYLIPIKNGIECVRELRKLNRDVPVIMITAYSSEQTRTEAFLAGCNEYLLKPVYPEKVFELLSKYLDILWIPHHLMN
jgi:CheY-like chemotaxis protein